MAQVTPFPSPSSRREPSRVRTALTWSIGFVALLWALEFLDQITGQHTDWYGIRPLDPDGLVGIVTAPFLHGGWSHLIGNSGPLLVLGFLILLQGVGKWINVSIVVMAIGGLGTWLFGGIGTVHIGASGLVFGYLAYLLVRGVVTRTLSQILVGVVVFVLYGSLLWGVLPSAPGVSWQGHLFGALGGVLAAWWLDRPVSRRGVATRR